MARDFAINFYKSRAWLRTRAAYIRSVHGECERCRAKGEFTPGYILHHKVHLTPENINDPEIALGWDNLEYVCLECHNAIHNSGGDVAREGLAFDNEGNLIEL